MKRSKVVITLNHDVMASYSLHMTLISQCGKRSEEDSSLNHDVYDIIPTPQGTQNSQIWGRLGRCNSISVHPYARLCIPGEFPKNYPGIPGTGFWDLGRIWASNMTSGHHFHLIRDPEFPHPGWTWLVWHGMCAHISQTTNLVVAKCYEKLKITSSWFYQCATPSVTA